MSTKKLLVLEMITVELYLIVKRVIYIYITKIYFTIALYLHFLSETIYELDFYKVEKSTLFNNECMHTYTHT